MSGTCIIARISSPGKAAAAAPPGIRAPRAAGGGRRDLSPRSRADRPTPTPAPPSRSASGTGRPAGERASPAAAASPRRTAPGRPRRRRAPPRVRRSPPPPPSAPHQVPRATRRTSPVPRAPRPLRPPSPVPFLRFRVPLHAIVEAHEPAYGAGEEAGDGQQGTRMQPAVHHPAEPAEQQDDGGQLEPHRNVRIALAEAAREPVFIVRGHHADGNIPACEKFRKQSQNHAN